MASRRSGWPRSGCAPWQRHRVRRAQLPCAPVQAAAAACVLLSSSRALLYRARAAGAEPRVDIRYGHAHIRAAIHIYVQRSIHDSILGIRGYIHILHARAGHRVRRIAPRASDTCRPSARPATWPAAGFSWRCRSWSLSWARASDWRPGRLARVQLCVRGVEQQQQQQQQQQRQQPQQRQQRRQRQQQQQQPCTRQVYQIGYLI